MKLIRNTLGVLLLLGVAFFAAEKPAYADSLQIRPLMYVEQLAEGEVKAGYVDIANPSNHSITVQTDVEGFKQVDAAGTLEFFDVDYLNEAILLDLEQFDLGPKESLRLFFQIDSKKLPQGDNFAAIFVRTTTPEGEGIATAVRAGTLLVIENGDVGPRNVALSDISTSFWHFGNGVSGDVGVKNIADASQANGFFPTVTATVSPLFATSSTTEGPLIFAGIERRVPFEVTSSRIGFYKVTLESNGATTEKWVFMLTGWWRWVVLSVTLAIIATIIAIIIIKKRPKKYVAPQ